jgi:hypothetical protein
MIFCVNSSEDVFAMLVWHSSKFVIYIRIYNHWSRTMFNTAVDPMNTYTHTYIHRDHYTEQRCCQITDYTDNDENLFINIE